MLRRGDNPGRWICRASNWLMFHILITVCIKSLGRVRLASLKKLLLLGLLLIVNDKIVVNVELIMHIHNAYLHSLRIIVRYCCIGKDSFERWALKNAHMWLLQLISKAIRNVYVLLICHKRLLWDSCKWLSINAVWFRTHSLSCSVSWHSGLCIKRFMPVAIRFLHLLIHSKHYSLLLLLI